MTLTLYVGNRAYSSWSLRASLAVAATGLEVEEVVIPLYEEGSKEAIRARSPAGRVPVLHHDDRIVWDSLAIAEYAAELAPQARLWPEEPAARAYARSISAEMHSGFEALRRDMTMNVRKERPGVGHSPEALADAARIMTIWREARARYGAGGPYLFGHFTIADAMYAPVATRFRTYAVPLDEVAGQYVEAIYAYPPMQRWLEAAHQEPWVIPQYES